MVITKDMLQHILDEMPQEMDIEEVFNKILLSVKIEQALLESQKGLGQDWNDFKTEVAKNRDLVT